MSTKQLYSIEGMSCAACATAVEQAAAKLPQVVSATVNLATEMLQVEWDNPQSDSQLIEAVKDAGYTATIALSATQQYQLNQNKKIAELQAQKHQLIQMASFAIPLFIITMGPMIGLPLPKWLSPHHAPLTHTFIQLLLTLPVMWLARDIYQRGYKTLWAHHPNMDSLVAIGTTAAFIQSLITLVQLGMGSLHHHTHLALYFESIGVILTLMKLGKFMEALAKGKTSAAVKSLMDLAPSQATRLLPDGSSEIVAVEMLEIGDHIQVKPGESIALDGVIIKGTALVDESMLTGESLPITKHIGDTVTGASINKTGAFVFEVTKVGQATMLAQIVQLVQEAQGSKAPIAKLADIIAAYFVPIVMGLALFTAGAWYLFGGQSLEFSLQIFISILIIACPCALGLATPTAIMVGTGNAAQKGILIKSGAVLETISKVNAILLDKTGTITEGHPSVTAYDFIEGVDARQMLGWVASAETHSEHPLAEALVRYVQEDLSLPLDSVDHFESITGQGIIAQIKGHDLRIGNPTLLGSLYHSDHPIVQQTQQYKAQAQTVIYVAMDQELIGAISIADTIKASSLEAIQALHARGIEVMMLTGDNEQTAAAIAQQVGIQRYQANVLPENKVAMVKSLQAEHKIVMMVGDGINDAPALAQAEVGAAIGSGTDIAIEAADLVLMHSDLKDIVKAIELSAATILNIKENLFWAFAYNIVGIPVAMGVLHILFKGPLLNPMLAALAMSFSSVSVLLNALRLRYK